MELALGIFAICLTFFIVSILAKTAKERDDRKRKNELLKQIVEHYDGLREIEAADLLYVSIVRQLYRMKLRDIDYEHLRRDANLVLDIRNGFIENEVIREIDEPRINTRFQLRRTTYDLANIPGR